MVTAEKSRPVEDSKGDIEWRRERFWKRNCELLSILEEKDDEIPDRRCTSHAPGNPFPTAPVRMRAAWFRYCTRRYRNGKAPPIEPFSGESDDLTFEDWLLSLERACCLELMERDRVTAT